MKRVALSLFGLGSALQGPNPVRKVVNLMQNMQKEVEEEGKKEKEMYEKFMCYCKNGKKQLEEETASATAEQEQQAAEAKEAAAEKKQVEADLKQLKADRADAQEELKKATALRAKEKAKYEEENAENIEDLKAMKAATAALNKGMGNSFLQTPTAGKLMEVLKNSDLVDTSMDADDKSQLLAFLSQSEEYTPQSNQIVGILMNMVDVLDKEMGGAASAEEAAAASFVELRAAKEAQIQAASEGIESKTARAGELALKVENSKNAAEDAGDEIAKKMAFLADLEQNCGTKDQEYAQRVATRAEEVKAIGEAIAVLNNDDALDTFGATKALKHRGQSFLQRSLRRNDPIVQAKEDVKKVQASSAAMKLKVHTILAQLTQSGKQGTGEDFGPVIKMIDDMISEVKAEQKEEEKKNDWCHDELHKLSLEDKDVERRVQGLDASIADKEGEIDTLKEEIEGGKKNIENLDKSVKEATEQRDEERKEFESEQELNSQALALLGKAKNRLNKFYNPDQYEAPKQRELTQEEKMAMAAGGEDPRIAEQAAAQAAEPQYKSISLLQLEKLNQPVAPEIFEGEYESKGQKSNSIIALMDTMIHDVELALKEGKMDEESAQKGYEKLVTASTAARAAEVKSVAQNESTKSETATALAEEKETHSVTKKELLQVRETRQNTKNECQFLMDNMDARSAGRETDINALNKAKSVLSGMK